MTKSSDRQDRGTDSGPGGVYKVGNKKPPLNSRFKPGQSGNPSGRPKGRSNFGTTLLKELYKPVRATINGEPVKTTHDRLLAQSMVKDAITKGPRSTALLLNVIDRAEARLAAEEEARKKAEAEKPAKPFSWTEEQEKLLQEIERATGHTVDPLDDRPFEAPCRLGVGGR